MCRMPALYYCCLRIVGADRLVLFRCVFCHHVLHFVYEYSLLPMDHRLRRKSRVLRRLGNCDRCCAILRSRDVHHSYRWQHQIRRVFMVGKVGLAQEEVAFELVVKVEVGYLVHAGVETRDEMFDA